MIKKENEKLNNDLINSFVNELNIEPLIAELLLSRGINSIESAISFLEPKLFDLPDFTAYSGVKSGIERILQAQNNGETVVVYGDYDCDGICASVILSEALKFHGINTHVFIPNRLEEGYGLCFDTLEKIAEEYYPDLIITVDCGITSKDEIEYCQNELGIDVLVTDHHEPPAVLPECIVINPHVDNNKGLFVDYCGAGVAFMLVGALYGLEFACRFIDVCAVATMGDIVPLTGANRILVKYGIKKLLKNPNAGLKQLLDSQNVKYSITSHDLSFKVVPRINSLGRLGDASRAIALFTETDHFILSCLIKEMNDENVERQKLCLKTEREAEEQAREIINEHRAIVLCGDWHKGVLGISASKLVEKYYRPVILFTRNGDEITGSCRSIPDVNIFEILSAFKEHFTRFGGHSQAAGLSMKASEFAVFTEKFYTYLNSLPSELFEKNYTYDVDVTNQNLSDDFFEQLKLFEPFGYKNPKPTFKVELNEGRFSYSKNSPYHLSSQTKHGYTISAFFRGEQYKLLNSKAKKELLISLSKNVFNGREYSQAILENTFLTDMNNNKDSIQELISYAQTAKNEENCSKVYNKTEFFRVLVDLFKNKRYGNAVICYCYDTYNEVCKVFDEFNIKYEKFYSVKTNENTLNCVIYCPQKDYFCMYDNLFFADKPLGCKKIDSRISYSVNEHNELYIKLTNLKVDREVVGSWFVKIKKLFSENIIRSIVGAETALFVPYEQKAIFNLAWLILEEVDLIRFDEEKLYYFINNIRTDLTKSRLYSIINANG